MSPSNCANMFDMEAKSTDYSGKTRQAELGEALLIPSQETESESSSSELSGSFIVNDEESTVSDNDEPLLGRDCPSHQLDGKAWSGLMIEYLETLQAANRRLVRQLRKREVAAEICLHCGDFRSPEPPSRRGSSHEEPDSDVPVVRRRQSRKRAA